MRRLSERAEDDTRMALQMLKPMRRVPSQFGNEQLRDLRLLPTGGRGLFQTFRPLMV